MASKAVEGMFLHNDCTILSDQTKEIQDIGSKMSLNPPVALDELNREHQGLFALLLERVLEGHPSSIRDPACIRGPSEGIAGWPCVRPRSPSWTLYPISPRLYGTNSS